MGIASPVTLRRWVRQAEHRGFGHHSAAALIAMIYLCAGGITIDLPLR